MRVDIMIICCCNICHQHIKDGDFKQQYHFCARHEEYAEEYIARAMKIAEDGLIAINKNLEKYRNQLLRDSNQIRAVENAG